MTDRPKKQHTWRATSEPFDERCDDLDRTLDDLLDRSAPREVPSDLVNRIASASHSYLGIDGGTSRSRTTWTRLALAACATLAVGAALWVAGRSGGPMAQDMPIQFVQGVDLGSQVESLQRLQAWQRINDLSYATALNDLQSVVWAVENGATNSMILSPGMTPLERVENELDSVRVVSSIEMRGHS